MVLPHERVFRTGEKRIKCRKHIQKQVEILTKTGMCCAKISEILDLVWQHQFCNSKTSTNLRYFLRKIKNIWVFFLLHFGARPLRTRGTVTALMLLGPLFCKRREKMAVVLFFFPSVLYIHQYVRSHIRVRSEETPSVQRPRCPFGTSVCLQAVRFLSRP